MNAWTGKVVAVTGGSAGLGLHIAQAFAERGANVAILGRDQARLEQAANGNARLLPFLADLADPEQTNAAVTAIRDRLGRLDVWVNNVGSSTRGEANQTTPDAIREGLEANLLTAVHGAQAALDALVASQGSLVFIGSLASKTASPYMSWYPAAKFAVAGYAHQLRLEISSRGVHVMLVCPGPIRREDAGERYAEQAAELPASANRPGGGAKIKGLDPQRVAEKIVRGCENRSPELVIPAKARLLFAIAQLSPRLGDWLLRKMVS